MECRRRNWRPTDILIDDIQTGTDVFSSFHMVILFSYSLIEPNKLPLEVKQDESKTSNVYVRTFVSFSTFYDITRSEQII